MNFIQIVLIPVFVLINVTGQSFPDIRKVQNGVLVTRHVPISVVRAEWNIIMSITAPTLPEGFNRQLDTISDVIRIAESKVLLSRHDLASLRRRVRRVTTITTASDTQKTDSVKIRQKRGLLNFVGEVASSLFGVATSGDIENMKEIIKVAMSKVNQLIHFDNELTSHVKHAFVELDVNRNRINELTDAMENMTMVVEGLIKSQQSWRRFMLTLVRIGQAVDAIESVAYAYRQMTMTFQRRTASLELGSLTEELFSPKDLKEIAGQIDVGVKLIEPYQWYYRNVVVWPLWKDPASLHFMAVLPLIDDGNYVEHGIHSWPVPLTVPGHYMQVMLSTIDIGLDTKTGWYFAPANCRGEAPRVCEGNLQINSEHIPCVVSILTNTTNPSCKIALSQSNDTSSKLYKGEYMGVILQTFGEKVKVHCTGKVTVERELANGVYVLDPVKCAYSGKGWHYRPIKAYEHRYAKVTPTINMSNIEIVDLLIQDRIVAHLKLTKWEHLQKVKLVSLAPLSDIDIDATGINNIGTHSMIIIALSVFIVLIIVTFILYRCDVISKIRKRYRSHKSKKISGLKQVWVRESGRKTSSATPRMESGVGDTVAECPNTVQPTVPSHIDLRIPGISFDSHM